jgi:hypothetical protein
VRLRIKTTAGADITAVLSVMSLPGTGSIDVHLRAVRDVLPSPQTLNPGVPLNPPAAR